MADNFLTFGVGRDPYFGRGPLGYIKTHSFFNGLKVLHNVDNYRNAVALAPAVGVGNYLTRNFRQKPIVGLQKWEHKPTKFSGFIPRKVSGKVPGKTSDVATVSNRRVKDYSVVKNKILPTNTKMVRKSTKVTKKSKKTSRKRRIPLAIPSAKLVRFRMVVSNSTTGTTGALSMLPWKANSLNDPSGTASASLPASLDQWSAMYTKYIVLGSKLKIRASATTQTGPVTVGLHLADNSTALSSHSHYRELPRTIVRTLSTTRNYTTMTMKYSGKKFWKLSNIKDDSEQEGALSTTPGDPTDIAYYHFFVQDQNGADTATVDWVAELEFICLLTNPINLDRSSL